jgi:protein tyrosine/serine phosphatase
VRYIKYLVRTIIITLLLVLILVASVETYKAIQGNFHTVKEQALYRSAKLRDWQLQNYIDEHGIQTIINLRGAMSDDIHYSDEVKVAQERNVTLINFGMSAYRYYDINQTQKIVALLKHAKPPILVHCDGGADRSALVSALYRYALNDENSTQAIQSFKWYYGYLPYGKWQSKENLRKSFIDYVTHFPKD